MPHAPTLPLRAPLATLAVLLPALLLGGCDAIYDDTKGWANRLEAKVLEETHSWGEPEPEAGPDQVQAALAEPAPPAVPVESVETAQLAIPPQPDPIAPLLPMTADPGVAAEPAPSAKAGSGPVAGLLPMTADPGAMAENRDQKAQKPASGKETKALPPTPLPKPKVPALAEGSPKKGSEKPSESASAEAAHAVVLHLSSLRSEDAAQREWSDLQQNFPKPLNGMTAEIRRTELGDKGTFYRVLAGPLPSRDKAREVCAELKAKNAKQYCRILPSKAKDS